MLVERITIVFMKIISVQYFSNKSLQISLEKLSPKKEQERIE